MDHWNHHRIEWALKSLTFWFHKNAIDIIYIYNKKQTSRHQQTTVCNHGFKFTHRLQVH